jgi:hypothetical protein
MWRRAILRRRAQAEEGQVIGAVLGLQPGRPIAAAKWAAVSVSGRRITVHG